MTNNDFEKNFGMTKHNFYLMVVNIILFFIIFIFGILNVNAESLSGEYVITPSLTNIFVYNGPTYSLNPNNFIYLNSNQVYRFDGQIRFYYNDGIDSRAENLIYPGTYLYDVMIYGNALVNHLNVSNIVDVVPEYVSHISGNWETQGIQAQVEAVDTDSLCYGYKCVHVLFRINFTGRYSGDTLNQFNIKFSSTNSLLFNLSSTYSVSWNYGAWLPYSSDLVDSFKNGAYQVAIQNALNDLHNSVVNGNQNIINNNNNNTNSIINNQNQNQQQTNQKLDGINNSLTNSSVDSPSGVFDNLNSLVSENNVISSLILMPVTLYRSILNNVNGTCSSFVLGDFLGTNIVFPCINISNYLGASLWGVIDVLISGFLIFSISKKFIKVFNSLSSLNEGDVIGD